MGGGGMLRLFEEVIQSNLDWIGRKGIDLSPNVWGSDHVTHSTPVGGT